jgi:hypothetical protein
MLYQTLREFNIVSWRDVNAPSTSQLSVIISQAIIIIDLIVIHTTSPWLLPIRLIIAILMLLVIVQDPGQAIWALGISLYLINIELKLAVALVYMPSTLSTKLSEFLVKT